MTITITRKVPCALCHALGKRTVEERVGYRIVKRLLHCTYCQGDGFVEQVTDVGPVFYITAGGVRTYGADGRYIDPADYQRALNTSRWLEVRQPAAQHVA